MNQKILLFQIIVISEKIYYIIFRVTDLLIIKVNKSFIKHFLKLRPNQWEEIEY